MPSPVCVSCSKAMKKVHMGTVVEFTRKGQRSQLPYKKHSGDKWECPGCRVQIISSYGEAVEHYEKAYHAFTPDIVVPEE